MGINNWSENIVLADLQDDPQFTEDLNGLTDLVSKRTQCDVVLDCAALTYLNSSNIAKLLKLRKLLHGGPIGRLKLCALSTGVWGVFLVTGLDKVFEFCDDVPSALASMQIQRG